MFPPPLYKKGQTGPFRPQLELDHYMYVLEECKHEKPVGNMEVILATDIEGRLDIAILWLVCHWIVSKSACAFLMGSVCSNYIIVIVNLCKK